MSYTNMINVADNTKL